MPEPFKNIYAQPFFDALCAAVGAEYPAFDRAAFLAGIYDGQWEGRELKARMRHVTLTLRPLLPGEYRAALDVLRRAARRLDERFSFPALIFPDFVEIYGLDDWEASIPALEQFTQQSTGEYAVRPFIVRDQDRMMAVMRDWARHDNHHVRRLASEGCRPRLPWGMALPAFKADPAPILPVLDTLKNDDSEYVRRSVANNLNDIAKDNPGVVLDVLRGWRAHHENDRVARITSHALRSLVKQGNPDALALLGYDTGGMVRVCDLTADETVAAGGALNFAFKVECHGDEAHNVIIDYIIYHQRANGQLTPKVFKLSKRTLAPGESLRISRKHSFKPVTTRRYYPGEHAIAVQINGVVSERRSFMLQG